MGNRPHLFILDLRHCTLELDMVEKIEKFYIILLQCLYQYLKKILLVRDNPCPILTQQLYNRLIPTSHSMEKRRPALMIGQIYIRTRFNQKLGHLSVTRGHSAMEDVMDVR